MESDDSSLQSAADAAAEAIEDATAQAADTIDRAIDEATGVPTNDGEIEEFTHDGSTLIAERRGDHAASTTVVLVHGIGMGRKVFADLSRRLEPEALVVSVDLPGYGEAPEPPRTPAIERMADLVAAYEQVIVTAAVEADVPPGLHSHVVRVDAGTILPAGAGGDAADA